MKARRLIGWAGAAVVAALLVVGAAFQLRPTPAAPAIPFAPLVDTAIKDPDNPTKVFRLDFARLEQEYPLSRADLAKLSPENIALLSQEQIDQIYGRLTAGPIPDGVYRGDFFFSRGDSLRSRLGEIIGGVEGRVAGALTGAIEAAGRTVWKGKMFDRDRRV